MSEFITFITFLYIECIYNSNKPYVRKKYKFTLKSGPIDQLWDFRVILRKVGFEPTRSVEHRDIYSRTM